VAARMFHEQLTLVSEISPDHTVTQSNELITSRQDLTIQERRIIYAFASLIDKNDGDFKTHRLKVKDIAEILGIQEKNYYKKVQEIVVGLQHKGIYVKKANSELYINWVASSEYFHGQGCVELEFSQKMKPYLLELQQRFTPFKLRNVLRLRSEYSMRIYELLKKDEYLRRARYSYLDFRQILNIGENKYKQYGHFKSRIINKAQEELAEHTDIKFDYKEFKKGRKVIGIEFLIHRNTKFVEKVINKSGNREIIQLLISYGIEHPQAERLVKEYGKDRVVRNIEYISSKKSSTNFQNIGGVIVDEVRKDYASSVTSYTIEHTPSVEQIIKDFIKKYRNSREALPNWFIRDEFEQLMDDCFEMPKGKIKDLWQGWENTIMKTIKDR
jgi:plasmid replication initiation protein